MEVSNSGEDWGAPRSFPRAFAKCFFWVFVSVALALLWRDLGKAPPVQFIVSQCDMLSSSAFCIAASRVYVDSDEYRCEADN